MKQELVDYVKNATSKLKKIDADDLVDAFNRAGLPVEVRRRRERHLWRYLIVPVVGLAVVGAYWLYRELAGREGVREWVDEHCHKNQDNGRASEPDAVQAAAEASFPASDPPSWNMGKTQES